MLIAISRVVAAVVRVSHWNSLDKDLLAPDSFQLDRGRVYLNMLTIGVPENYQIGGIIWY